MTDNDRARLEYVECKIEEFAYRGERCIVDTSVLLGTQIADLEDRLNEIEKALAGVQMRLREFELSRNSEIVGNLSDLLGLNMT